MHKKEYLLFVYCFILNFVCMKTAITIAQIVFPVFWFLALSLLINPGWYKDMAKDLWKNSLLLYFGGLMNLVIGAAIIFSYNVWTFDWTLLITLLGWMALVKGWLIMLFPGWVVSRKRSVMKKNVIMICGLVLAILTVVLVYGVYKA